MTEKTITMNLDQNNHITVSFATPIPSKELIDALQVFKTRAEEMIVREEAQMKEEEEESEAQ